MDQSLLSLIKFIFWPPFSGGQQKETQKGIACYLMVRCRLCLLYIKTYSVYNKCYFGQRRYCRRRPWLVFQFLSLTCYFIGYRRCCKKSIGKMWFGVLHTFHLKRAVYSRRINRGLPTFAAEFYAPELFKFPVVQQRHDQHHKAGTCIVTTPCATLGGGGSMTWGWKKPVRHFRPFFVE